MHITQIIFRAEQQNGDLPSTLFQGESMTWRQTAERIRKTAGGLQSLGLQRNDQIAILSLNSCQYLEALFAVPLMGARVVPLNIRWALPEFVYSLNDSASKALMFDKTFLPLVEQLRAQEVCVEQYLFMGDAQDCPDWAQPLSEVAERGDPISDFVYSDQSLAGIFYTGGTTGFPKGVMLTHTALFTSALSMVATNDADASCSYLHAAPMFHMADLAACYMFSALCARHVIIPAFDPVAVLNSIEQAQITDALLVPAMVQMVFDHPDFDAKKLRSLKRILYGASPMPEGLLRRVMAALPDVEMTQAYGQTELAPIATMLPPADHVTEGERSRLLRAAGQSSYAMLLKIIDDEGNSLPVGEVGEVCAMGPNTMVGYWNKPEQTAETLKNGWVHTGDAGYLDAQGYLFLVDRVKDMIVSGGENVYSAEVESVVSTHSSVAQVAVVGIPDDDWGEAVHAIVILKAGESGDVQSIIAHCKEQIAGYKCPKSVEFRTEAFPLSGAGKVLKRELRAPYWEGRDRQVN
ncbi:MAG: acyl-CoA synthetase [Oceanococcus sp.]